MGFVAGPVHRAMNGGRNPRSPKARDRGHPAIVRSCYEILSWRWNFLFRPLPRAGDVCHSRNPNLTTGASLCRPLARAEGGSMPLIQRLAGRLFGTADVGCPAFSHEQSVDLGPLCR